MPQLFLIWPVLEARAEILALFCCTFGKSKTPQICSEIIWPLDLIPHQLTERSRLCKIVSIFICTKLRLCAVILSSFLRGLFVLFFQIFRYLKNLKRDLISRQISLRPNSPKKCVKSLFWVLWTRLGLRFCIFFRWKKYFFINEKQWPSYPIKSWSFRAQRIWKLNAT